MPSSISVGATRSPKPTTNFANCLILITYLAGSLGEVWIILVQRATFIINSWNKISNKFSFKEINKIIK